MIPILPNQQAFLHHIPPRQGFAGVVPGNSVIVPTPKRGIIHQQLLVPVVTRILILGFRGTEPVCLDLAFQIGKQRGQFDRVPGE